MTTSILVTSAQVHATGCSPAEQAARMDFYGSSDVIPFFNPCSSGGACSVAGAGSIQSEMRGGSNAEKVWNYLIGRGLTPIAAAGAMGNIEEESRGFDPWSGETGNGNINKNLINVGFGLVQWTNTGGDAQGRRYKVMKHLEDSGVRLDATDPSQNDKALLLQLDWLWEGEYGKVTWSEKVNAETKVDGNPSMDFRVDNTGNGSAMLFHSLVERSGDDTVGKQQRIDSAQAYLEQFGGAGGGGSTGTVGNSSNNCGGGAGLTSGGADLARAQAIMQEYITSPEVDQLVGEQKGMCESGSGGWRANCVTFSKYFLRKFTTIEPAPADGKDVVRNTKAANPGTESGPTPRAYSVFSYTGGMATTSYGHTGVILAVDTTKGTMLVAEANCFAQGPIQVSSQIGHPFVVREAPIDSHPSNTEYLYTDGKTKGELQK